MKKQHFLYNFRLFLFLFQYSLCVLNCFPPALLRIDWDNMVFIHPIYHFRCQQAVVETDCVLRSKFLVWEDCSSLSLIIFQYNKLLQRPSTLHSCPGAKLTPCQEDETCRECLPHTQTHLACLYVETFRDKQMYSDRWICTPTSPAHTTPLWV